MVKEYSTNYHAQYIREKRKQIAQKNPIALCKTVWIVETKDGQQVVFKNKKDIQIKRISKNELKSNFIKSY
jgi:hypothetical protein